MDENGGNKLRGIRQIVRLKELLQKWQSVTLGSTSKPNSPTEENQAGSISRPSINKRLTTVVCCDLDEDSCQSPEHSHSDIPKGYLAVYVGPELRRFVIPTTYLSHSLFKVLLEKVEEEFGFNHSGGLTIPCDTEIFKYLLKCMESHQNSLSDQSDDANPEEAGISTNTEE